VAHSAEGEEALRAARLRLARKPQALARELLRNFPKRGGKQLRRRPRPAAKQGPAAPGQQAEQVDGQVPEGVQRDQAQDGPPPAHGQLPAAALEDGLPPANGQVADAAAEDHQPEPAADLDQG